MQQFGNEMGKMEVRPVFFNSFSNASLKHWDAFNSTHVIKVADNVRLLLVCTK